MKFLINRCLTLFALLAAGLLLSACGGGGSAGGGTGTATGSVALLVTDAPSDDFSAINLTVTRAELIGGPGHVVIFQGRETFNLLDLKSDARMFAVDTAVPPHRYNKIRLTLEDIELVRKDGSPSVHPKLPGNNKLDLVARGGFQVQPGSSLLVQIDMDAEKSIHITGNGKYEFRPVVFVEVIDALGNGKLVRLNGVVDDLDVDNNKFKLCTTAVPVHHDDDGDDSHHEDRCVKVLAGGASVFGPDGLPVTLASLSEGDLATVVGRLRPEDDDDDEDHEAHHRSGDDSSDDSSDDSGSHDERELHDMRLQALVIEQGAPGTFETLEGSADGGVDSAGQFGVTPAAGGASVVVQMQAGTRVVSRRGDLLDDSAIQAGRALSVDGVRDAADVLLAALVVVDAGGGSLSLSGTVASNPDGACGFSITTATGDRSVSTDSNTRVYRVGDDGSGAHSEEIAVGDLVPGDSVDVYGHDVNGCFQADSIIVLDLAS